MLFLRFRGNNLCQQSLNIFFRKAKPAIYSNVSPATYSYACRHYTLAGIRYVGFRLLDTLHSCELTKPGSSEHEVIVHCQSKADNGTFGTD
ncbi:hypothetical protein HDC90_002344 [Pedobacter sp. AK013]|nr:hypothetical protein [Pedobacter sp. AK013]